MTVIDIICWILIAMQATSLFISVKRGISPLEHWYGISLWAMVPVLMLNSLQ